MHKRHLTLVIGLAILVRPSSIAAQATPQLQDRTATLAHAAPSLPQRVPIHTAPADRGAAYGVWAGGRDYKVSFHDGMTFVPYLGREYPRSQPWTWRTASVRIGEHEFDTAPAQRSVWHDDYRFEFRYPGFVEAYDVMAGGVEQTFVFASLPGAGDLVVSGTITSGLHRGAASRRVAGPQAGRLAPAVPRHGSLTFVDEDGAAITEYGAAVVIDGRGRRLPIATECDGETITLTVPQSWLQTATLPIVIDPIIANVSPLVAALGSGVHECDVAWEDESPVSNLMVAFTNFASANDGDLRAYLCNDDYSNTNLIYTDVTASWSTEEVSCAYVGGADRWAVVFARRSAGLSPIRSALRVHVHDRMTTTLQSNYASLALPGGHNDWRPDVGGSASNVLGDKALVVFQREDNSSNGNNFANTANSEVHGVMIDMAAPSGAFSTPFPIQGNLLIDCEHPSVNQVSEGGTDYSWICALQTFNNWTAADDWDVWAWRVGNDATVATGSFQSDIGTSNGFHQFRPIVEGNHGRYAVVFTTATVAAVPGKPLDTAGAHVRLERFDWAQAAAAPDPAGDKPPYVICAAAGRELHATGLAYDVIGRSHWVACMHYENQQRVRYCRVGYNGYITAQNDVASLPYPVTMTPCTFNDDFLNVHIVYNWVGFGIGLSAATLAYPSETVWSTTGAGCTTAGYIGWSGSQQIGSEFSGPGYSWASPTAVHVMAVSTASASVPLSIAGVAPGCSVLIDPTAPNFLGTMPVMVGQFVSWPLPLPETLPPMTLYFQDWILDGGVFTSSERMRVPLHK